MAKDAASVPPRASPLASFAATGLPMSLPAAVSSTTILLVVAEANSGATFATGAFMIFGASSMGLTMMVTMIEEEAAKESSAVSVTM